MEVNISENSMDTKATKVAFTIIFANQTFKVEGLYEATVFDSECNGYESILNW